MFYRVELYLEVVWLCGVVYEVGDCGGVGIFFFLWEVVGGFGLGVMLIRCNFKRIDLVVVERGWR